MSRLVLNSATICPSPEISVVIPTRNGATRILGTLRSVVGQTLPAERFEVIVIDDGSVDSTAAVVKEFAAKNAELSMTCLPQVHGGVNAARNAGIVASRGALVAFLDDDEEAPCDHLQRLVDLMARPDGLDGAGGPARLMGSPPFRTCSTCSIGDARLPIDGAGVTGRLLGGNMTVRRAVFDEVGLFDPELSGRGDETEWFARAGRRFWYDDSLFVWHRRDHLSLRQLLRNGFRQGQSVPKQQSMSGTPWRPSPGRLVRYLGHAARARCVNGLLQASRESGSLVGWASGRVRHLRATMRR